MASDQIHHDLRAADIKIHLTPAIQAWKRYIRSIPKCFSMNFNRALMISWLTSQVNATAGRAEDQPGRDRGNQKIQRQQEEFKDRHQFPSFLVFVHNQSTAQYNADD